MLIEKQIQTGLATLKNMVICQDENQITISIEKVSLWQEF